MMVLVSRIGPSLPRDEGSLSSNSWREKSCVVGAG